MRCSFARRFIFKVLKTGLLQLTVATCLYTLFCGYTAIIHEYWFRFKVFKLNNNKAELAVLYHSGYKKSQFWAFVFERIRLERFDLCPSNALNGMPDNQ